MCFANCVWCYSLFNAAQFLRWVTFAEVDKIGRFCCLIWLLVKISLYLDIVFIGYIMVYLKYLKVVTYDN